MKRLLFAGAAVAALAVAAPASAQTKTLKLLSSWDRSNYAALEGALVYQEQLKKLSGGKLVVDLKGPETVPPFQQIQPVSAGVFDFFDKYYQKHNKLTMIAMPIIGTHGYQIVLRDALSAEGDFKGRKIRCTQSYFGVVKALGGTPVVLPPAEVYSALEKGVVEGATWPAAGIYTMKWYEVAHYRVRPTFGTTNTPMLINMNAWGKLTAAEQKLLLDAGRETEKLMIKQGDVTLAKEEAELDKLGMKYAQLSPEKGAMVKRLWVTSLWELAEQCCADGAKELREIARKANLTN